MAGLLDTLKNHIGEVYGTLSGNERVKQRAKGYADQAQRGLLQSLPMLSKDPQYVSAEDLLNSGFGVMPLSVKAGENFMDVIPETEFSKAHKIAQKNATLPVEKGGLGLPPDNTAMDRAKALGFDIPAYHGTTGDITDFKLEYSGRSGVPKTGKDKAVWASNLPEDAAYYARLNIPRRLKELQALRKHTPDEWDELSRLYDEMYKGRGIPREENIMPLLINKGSVMEMDTKGIPSTFKKQANDFIKSANETLILKNANPGFADKRDFLSKLPYSEYYAVKDPKNIRSIFAAFDPKQRNSANLLASGLLGSLILNDYMESQNGRTP